MGDAERREQHRLENLKRRLENVIETSPVLKSFRPQLLIDLTTEGLRIQIIDNQNRPMFATGRAEVQPYMRDILRELGPVLNELPNRVSISGHTDASQYARGERAYSNWELSADRANASRQELVAGGMSESKVMRIQGLSSSMSLVKDDPYAAVNRRISLVVLNMNTQKRIENENAAAADVSAKDAREVGTAVEAVQAAAQAATATNQGEAANAPPVQGFDSNGGNDSGGGRLGDDADDRPGDVDGRGVESVDGRQRSGSAGGGQEPSGGPRGQRLEYARQGWA